MIKIKKLLISNFKGIKKQVIVDFQKSGSQNQILSGPNGFGKTTIFEALELCITGKFDRIETFKDVQLRNKNRNKPFFQNTSGQNVIIKLLIEKDEQEIVISKIYDDLNSPKRMKSTKNNLPEESHAFFSTFISNDKRDFESLLINELMSVNQEVINEIFLGDNSKVDLESIYYLFNYIQQEDSIRFLKQREDDKGNSLAFLFNLEKEESEQSELDTFVSKLKAQEKVINEEIGKLESSFLDNDTVIYKRIFEDKEFSF